MSLGYWGWGADFAGVRYTTERTPCCDRKIPKGDTGFRYADGTVRCLRCAQDYWACEMPLEP
jgi:hypothetical protein